MLVLEHLQMLLQMLCCTPVALANRNGVVAVTACVRGVGLWCETNDVVGGPVYRVCGGTSDKWTCERPVTLGQTKLLNRRVRYSIRSHSVSLWTATGANESAWRRFVGGTSTSPCGTRYRRRRRPAERAAAAVHQKTATACPFVGHPPRLVACPALHEVRMRWRKRCSVGANPMLRSSCGGGAVAAVSAEA